MKTACWFSISVIFFMAFSAQAFSVQPLTRGEREALGQALQDEYKAQATYQKVMSRFGEIRPFSNIVQAEQRHINALVSLFDFYQIAVPENKWREKLFSFASVKEACQAGADAEIKNAGLYEVLLSKVEKEDVKIVFRNLQRASQEHHLKAFQRCVQRYE